MANGNLHLPAPPELQGLTEAELLFIARGFTVVKLKSLPAKGPPEARQRALLGNVISFPQDAAQLVHALPRSAASVAEMLSVFFPPEDANSLRHIPEFIVRQARVRAALLWLQKHNPFYAPVALDEEALETLPQEAVPAALLQAARPLPPEDAPTAHEGPAEAVCAPALSRETADVRVLSAAVLDTEGEATHPLARWQHALTAVEDAAATLAEAPGGPLQDFVVSTAVAATTSLLAPAAADMTHTDAVQDANVFAVVPHGTVPLSAFDPAYWTFCFPHLFPYGEPTEQTTRTVHLPDRDWARMLLSREDRTSEQYPWRLDHSFIAVVFAVLHRRALMRAVRAKLSSPTFQRTVQDLQSLRSVDFAAVYETLGEHGGVPQALEGAGRLVTGSVGY